MTEIPLQLALYAHATHWWDGQAWQPMIPVDQHKAVVIHLPVGQGKCLLYEVDIDAGWEAVQLAMAVRSWRKRQGLCEQIPTMKSPTNRSNARLEWVRAMVDRIKTTGPDPTTALAMLWSTRPDIPTFPNGGPRTNDEIDIVAGWCRNIEDQFEFSFGSPDPDTPQATKATKARAQA
jgi:hypothetical protein